MPPRGETNYGRKERCEQNFKTLLELAMGVLRAAIGEGARRMRNDRRSDACRRDQDDLTDEVGGRAIASGSGIAHEVKHHHAIERGVKREDDA